MPTYQGVVRQGKIQLTQAAHLTEGSQVVVLAVDDWTEEALLDPHIARRTANGWLVTHVGSVMAQQPQLQQIEGRLVWRFKAFLTTQGQPPRGPVGFVDIDAYSGEVLTGEEIAAEIIAHATATARSLSSSNS
jgi:hypothetical protein